MNKEKRWRMALFGAKILRVVAVQNTKLDEKVGEARWVLEKDGVVAEPGEDPLQLFGMQVGLKAPLKLHVEIPRAKDDPTTLFGSEEEPKCGEGKSLAQLEFDAGLQATLGATTSPWPVLSAEGTFRGTAGVHYKHVLPVSQDTTRKSALRSLIRTAALPEDIEPRKLKRGEGHRYQGAFSVDLGLNAALGWSTELDRVMRTFNSFPLEVSAHLNASLNASLGYSFYDHMTVAISRVAANRVRLRMERSRKDALTLGARLALHVAYDFGERSLISILEHALDQDPAQEILRAMHAIHDLGQGDWSKVREELGDRAGEALERFIDSTTHWREWSSDSMEVQCLLELSNRIVKIFDGLDERIQSWWSDLLTWVELDDDGGRRLREVLTTISQLKSPLDVVNQFLPDEAAFALDLLEALSGLDIDELIIKDDPEVEEAIGLAAERASQALHVLNELPADFVKKFDRFKKRTGIEQAVAWLKSHMGDENQIRSEIDARIKALVEILLQKTWNTVNDKDIEDVSLWAEEFDREVLQKIEQLDRKLRHVIQHLRGEAGCFLGLQWQRTTECHAVLDMDFDPSRKAVCSAVRTFLKEPSLKQLFQRLPEPEDKENPDSGKDQEPETYRIREGAFSFHRVRSAAFVSSLLGARRVRYSDGFSVYVSQHGSHFRRAGRYQAGFVRVMRTPPCEAGIQLEVSAHGTDKDVRCAYDTLDGALRWTLVWQEEKISSSMMKALESFMEAFGFSVKPPLHELKMENHSVSMSMSVRVPLNGHLQTLLNIGSHWSRQEWNETIVRAARDWFSDGFVTTLLKTNQTGGKVLEGRVLAALVDTPTYRQLLEETALNGADKRFTSWRATPENISVLTQEGLKVDLRVKPHAISGGAPLRSVLHGCLNGWTVWGSFSKKLLSTREQTEPTALHRHTVLKALMPRVARCFRKSGATKWDDPTFMLWFGKELARACCGTTPLHFEGLAVFRWTDGLGEPGKGGAATHEQLYVCGIGNQ
ncbi:MAG: hypothetical protein GXP47_06380 [Acidobacteria bacterium]|nr:hypothetical protein [Acidobacteriota bacterium]